ncbi:MAG TPA: hypothetical protein O0W90_04325 [Methanocorpusculum sp.]|nr:hypothetical protein [Methanocorpusculum sp.]
MKKELKEAQTTVKMPPSLKKEIDSAAEILGISSMEYIRRACREKIDRESDNNELRKQIIEILNEHKTECRTECKNEIRKQIIEILKELGIECSRHQ